MTIRTIIAATLLAATAVPAMASTIYFNDRTLFTAATSQLTFESFEHPSVITTYYEIDGDVTTSSSGGLFSGAYPTDGVRNVAAVSPSEISFGFSRPIHAFGIDITGLGSIGSTNLTLSYAGGSAIVIANHFDTNLANTRFVGITDNIAFTAVTLRGDLAGDVIEYDGLNFSAPSDVGGVPEPASWAMLIAGFGLTGAAMRRRAVPTVAA